MTNPTSCDDGKVENNRRRKLKISPDFANRSNFVPIRKWRVLYFCIALSDYFIFTDRINMVTAAPKQDSTYLCKTNIETSQENGSHLKVFMINPEAKLITGSRILLEGASISRKLKREAEKKTSQQEAMLLTR